MGKTVRYGNTKKETYREGCIGKKHGWDSKEMASKRFFEKRQAPLVEEDIPEPEEVLCLEWDDEMEDFVWVMRHPEYAN